MGFIADMDKTRSLPQFEAVHSGLSIGGKHVYATKADLERLVRRMQRAGSLYPEATREFKKQFILVALRTAHWNQSRAAQALGIHRNTLLRNLRSLDIDLAALRKAERLPPHRADVPLQKKIAS